MKLNFKNSQGFTVSAKLHALLNCELAKVEKPGGSFYALTFNFRDPNYSTENGGYHPVELRLEKHKNEWQFIYITDFSYQGGPYPELVKDIDVCFEIKRVYSLFGGWLNARNAKELITLFISNFIEYHAMETYQTNISFR
jgi:hypothetical protein